MKRNLVSVSLVVVTLALSGTSAQPGPLFERAKVVYLENRLDSAELLFAQAAAAEPKNAEVLSWYAECLRRLGQIKPALQTAYQALAIDSCNSLALGAIGDAVFPQYGQHEFANRDSSLQYLMRAIACDSSNVNEWCTIWAHAVTSNREGLESLALDHMYRGGFFTPTNLEQARFYLRSLPANAILLTNGDMDTYPTRAVQQVEGFRTDVALVNASMLNVAAYGEYVTRLNKISDAFPDGGWQRIEHLRRDTLVVTVAHQVIERWIEMIHSGELSRPVAACLTVSESSLPAGFYDHAAWKGAFYEWSAELSETQDDTLAVLAAIDGVDLVVACGPTAAAKDRSPVRVSASNNRLIANNFLQMLVWLCFASIETGQCKQAESDLKRLEDVIEKAAFDNDWRERAAALREHYSEACPKK